MHVGLSLMYQDKIGGSTTAVGQLHTLRDAVLALTCFVGQLLVHTLRYALLALTCFVGFFFPLGAFAVAQKHHGFPDLHLGLLVGFFLGLLAATNKRCKMLVLLGGCSGLVGIATFDPAIDFPGHGVHGLVYHGSCVAIAMAYFCGL